VADWNKYRIWCATEGQYVYALAEEEPTTCPNDPAHNIDESKTSIVEKKSDKPKTDVDGNAVVVLDAPREATDKKPVMVISPATEGFLTFITSCGDNFSPTPPDTGRGSGDQILILTSDSNDPDYLYSKEVQFLEPVEIHDGQVCWRPVESFEAEDRFSLCARVPATQVTPGGLKNCVLVPTGYGFNAVVPMQPGSGTHEVNLATAGPLPNHDKTGYWDVEYNTGAVSPSATPGEAAWNLFDAELLVYFIKNVSMANPLGVFDIDVYKTEYFHQNWVLRFEVFKKNAANGKVSGWIFMFRRHVN